MLDPLIQLVADLPLLPLWLGAILLDVTCFVAMVYYLRSAATEPPGETLGVRRVSCYVAALRVGALGLCAMGLALGGLLDSPVLIGLSLVIGFQEVCATTLLLGVLRLGLQVETRSVLAAGEVP